MLEVIQKNESSSHVPLHSAVLDIETTGLRKANDTVFLLGIRTAEEFRQWLITSREEEANLLEDARPYLDGKTLITYNGDLFDLPFLQERFATHGIPFPSVLSQDWFSYLRPRRLFFRFPNLRLRTLASAAGLVRHDPYTGKEIALFGKHLTDPEAKNAVLLHNQEDVDELSLLLPFFQRLQKQLQLEAPLSASLESVTLKGDLATLHYRTETPACPERHTENSFGALHWTKQDLHCVVPIHPIDFPLTDAILNRNTANTQAPRHEANASSGNTPRIAAVSPSYAKDCAIPPLPRPFLTLSSAEGYFAQNCHQLVRDLFSMR